jgi:hypothetical protein
MICTNKTVFMPVQQKVVAQEKDAAVEIDGLAFLEPAQYCDRYLPR